MEKHRIKIRCLLAQETEIKFGCIKETYSENMSLAIWNSGYGTDMYLHIRFKMFFLFRTLAMSKMGETYCHGNIVEVCLIFKNIFCL
jgi:hypothetical protein